MSERITYIGEQVHPRTKRGRFTSFNSKVKRATRYIIPRAGIAIVAFAILSGVYFYGQFEASREISAVRTITNVVMQPVGIAPVLHRIALAESGDKQYGKDGQVVIHVNNNGTYDTGRFQVNSIWNKLATKMGYDLMKEKDNEAFAIYLFNEHGSTPWESSRKNWQ